jgi:WD40 repeat protein
VSYHVFISYGRRDDEALAAALQLSLRRIARPWYRRESVRVFRDDTDLSVSPSLWTSIEQALVSSEYMLLLASPAAVQSRWVAREIDAFVQRRGPERLLLALTHGRIEWDLERNDFDWTVTDAVPHSLAGIFRDEPRYLDLRWAADPARYSLRDPQWHDHVADLAAVVLAMPKDALVGEDRRQHRRNLRIAKLAVAAVATLAIGVGIAGYVASQQRATAISNEHRARESEAVATDRERAALSRRLAAQAKSLHELQPIVAQLLSVESYHASATTEAWGSLIDSASTYPSVIRMLDSEGEELTSHVIRDDGAVVATGSRSGSIWLWSVESGKRERHFETGDARLIHALALSNDGHWLAATTSTEQPGARTETSKIFVWDLTGDDITPTSSLVVNTRSVRVLAFDPKGHNLAAGGWGGELVLWAFSSRGKDHVVLHDHESFVNDLAFSADGARLVSASADGRVHVRNAGTRAIVHTVIPYPRPRSVEPAVLLSPDRAPLVSAVALSPDGSLLQTLSTHHEVILWNAETGAVVRSVKVDVPSRATSDVLGRDGTTVAVAAEASLYIYDLAHSIEPTILALPRDLWLTISVGSSSRIVVGSASKVVVIEPGAKSSFHDEECTYDAAPNRPLALTLDGRYVAYVAIDEAIYLRDTLSCSVVAGPLRALLRDDRDAVSALALALDGKTLAAGTVAGTIQVWALSSGRKLQPRAEFAGEIVALAFSRNSELIAAAGTTAMSGAGTADAQYSVHFLNAVTGSPLPWSPSTSPAPVSNIAFAPDDKLLAVADSQQVTIYDVVARRRLHTLNLPSLHTSLAFDAMGSTIAAASAGNTVLWDLRSPDKPRHITAHPQAITMSIAVTPDGKLVATAGDDGRVRLWDASNGQPLGEGFEQPSHANSAGAPALALSVDPAQHSPVLNLAHASGIMRWRFGPAMLQKLACSRAGRNPTTAEWREYIGTTTPMRPTCAR